MSKQSLIYIFLILCIPIAFFFGKKTVTPKINSNTIDIDRGQAIRQSGFEFINPLLECEIASEADFKELTSFRTELQAVIEKQKSAKQITYASVYFRDLNNGPWIGVNEKESFSPASLLKLPLAISIYKQAESKPDILKSEVRFSGKLNRDDQQLILPDITVQPDKQYTVSDLLDLMLQYSDNNSAELLLRLITPEVYFQTYKDLSLPLPVGQNGQPYNIRVKDYASFFRILFNGSYIDRQYSNQILKTLTGSKFANGLRAGVPDSVQIAHKFGERSFQDSSEKQLHDCGIVYYPKKPYLLCIMTRGNNYKDLENAIAQLSKETYKQVDQQVTPKSSN